MGKSYEAKDAILTLMDKESAPVIIGADFAKLGVSAAAATVAIRSLGEFVLVIDDELKPYQQEMLAILEAQEHKVINSMGVPRRLLGKSLSEGLVALKPTDLFEEELNDQPRNREYGWYRKFEKVNGERNK